VQRHTNVPKPYIALIGFGWYHISPYPQGKSSKVMLFGKTGGKKEFAGTCNNNKSKARPWDAHRALYIGRAKPIICHTVTVVASCNYVT
jgi:hypothetical protein